MRGHIEFIDHAMVEVLRKKTPAEKLAMADRMWEYARGVIRIAVRAQHPDWTDEQLQREVIRRLSHGAC